MAAADGVFAENEKKAIALELARFGVSESNMPSLFAAAQVGIDPTGKSKLELAKEVYERRGLVYHDG